MPDVVGTWRYITGKAHDGNGNKLPDPYGPLTEGLGYLSADGRMMVVMCDHAQNLAPGQSRFYASYCGRYTYDGTTLTTKVYAASDPSRVGGEQVRGVRFEGEQMVLSLPPAKVGDVILHREMYWERLSSI
jgi:hypothetical protein